MAPARRTALGGGVRPRAQRAAQLPAVAREGARHAAVRAAQDRAALVAGQRGGPAADDERRAAPLPLLSSMARVSGSVRGDCAGCRACPRSRSRATGRAGASARGDLVLLRAPPRLHRRAWRRAAGAGCRRGRRAAAAGRASAGAARPAACGPDRARRSAPAWPGGGSGASRAERVPTTTRLRPREAANQARRRSGSDTPLSRRAASSRRAQRAAASRSGAMTSAAPRLPLERLGEPGLAAHDPPRARARARRPGGGSAGGETVSAAEARGAGGSRDRRVEPHDERLSPAAQRVSSSAASDSTGTGSTARWSGFSAVASPSRSPTTTPTRLRPWQRRAHPLAAVSASRPAGTA